MLTWEPQTLQTLAMFVAIFACAAGFYLLGRRNSGAQASSNVDAKRELRRAQAVIRELEGVGQRVRICLARHHSSLAAFHTRIGQLSRDAEADPWKDLSQEAEQLLKPTLQLSTQLAHAYDEIRQQTNQLMTFTEVRTDPLTGLRNRRALDEALHSLFALAGRYGATFSVAILDIDHFKRINDEQGHLQGDHILQQLARTLDDAVRDTDTVARFGGEEFVVLMPETGLEGACIFTERAREMIESQIGITVSGGVAQAVEGDSSQTLISRADAALYSAKSAGRNFVFKHEGDQILPVGDRAPIYAPSPSEDPKTKRVSSTANAADNLAGAASEKSAD